MTGIIALTGVNRGIGAALTTELLGRGWRVHGIGRARAPVTPSSDAYVHHDCDLSDLNQLAIVGAGIREPLDVVFNNAAVFGNGAYFARDFDPAAFEDALRINVVAPALLTRLLKPQLSETGRRLVVMMSTGNASLAGNVTGEMLAYRSSKSALNQVVRTMAAEWADDRITVAALNPGWVQTDMGGPSAPTSPEEAARDIVAFIEGAGADLSGRFVNPDGSDLPW